MKFFTGSLTHKVDAKGRVSLPADFRKVLENVDSTHVVVLPQMQHPDYHVVLSQPGHEKIVEQFEEMDLSHDDREAMARLIVTDARQISFDDAGRIVLSKDLREQIGLGGEVRFVGRGSFFQLWEPGKCAAYEAAVKDRGRDLATSIRLGGLH
ncbi:MAG: division/cell wall cluster transcriptional repressor MraZ [Alphaproteobacteria bacterium]